MLATPRQRLHLISPYRLSRTYQRRFANGSETTARSTAKDEIISFSWINLQATRRTIVPLLLVSTTIGFVAGRMSVPSSQDTTNRHVLPNGIPRTCCGEAETYKLTENQEALFKGLKRIVGKENVLHGTTETTETSQYLKGARLGRGTALYIVKPQKLKHVIQIVQAVLDADCVILVQGQNTGLTGGSVPRNHPDSRPTVIISMKDLDTIFPIDNGERVVCLGGTGLASLQNFVATEFPHRESHSILGSTFLNPTTAAGVAFGSGGTQCRKGPAFTERALYLKIVSDKLGCPTVKMVNTLGIEGFDQEEGEFEAHWRHNGVTDKLDNYLRMVQGHHDYRMKESNQTYGKAAASAVEYKKRICKASNEVNRYNADTSGNECNRSEGKVLILASVHDTFPRPASTKTFWLSFDSLETAFTFRRQVCLENPTDLPISIEYMDRDSFDVIDRSGRILGNLIKIVGPSSPVVRTLWNVKLWIEALDFSGAPLWVDKLLYTFNPIVPSILPRAIMELGRQRDHHVAMTVGDFDGSLDRFLNRMKKFQEAHGDEKIAIHECSSKSQEASLTAFRFIAAPAFRTWCVGQGMQGISVDYALPGNSGQAPSLSSSSPAKRMRYSHFACNVFHEDLAFEPNVDVEEAKLNLKRTVESECGGKLPAEHGHGTEYSAPEETRKRWKQMDPLNVMNPGIGGLSYKLRYKN